MQSKEIKLSLSQAIEKAYKDMQRGQVKSAFDLAYQLNKVKPNDYEVNKLLGLLHSSQGKQHSKKCIQFLKKATPPDQIDVDICLALARAYLNEDLISKAYHELDQAQEKLKHKNAIIEYIRGSCFVKEHKWTEAKEIFSSLLDQPNLQKVSRGWLGVIAVSEGKDDEALTYFSDLNLAGKTIYEDTFYVFQRHYRDILFNQKTSKPDAKKILVLRHPNRNPDFYQLFFDWLSQNYPEYLSYFELRLLTYNNLNPDHYALHIPWFQDPVQHWSQLAYEQALSIEALCAQNSIKVVNPVSQLTNAGKFEGALKIQAAGFRTPKMVLIADFSDFKKDLGGLSFPFFIRENWGHGDHFYKINNSFELNHINPDLFERPVAVELIDVQSPDGLYRKYRYFAIGSYGNSNHLQITEDWITRGSKRVYNELSQNEELDFIAKPNPHHDLFQKAKDNLKLDYLAFDYGYDKEGKPVVWEANPYPHILWPKVGGKSEYRASALHRCFASMLLYYLESAGITPKSELKGLANYDPNTEDLLTTFKRPTHAEH